MLKDFSIFRNKTYFCGVYYFTARHSFVITHQCYQDCNTLGTVSSNIYCFIGQWHIYERLVKLWIIKTLSSQVRCWVCSHFRRNCNCTSLFCVFLAVRTNFKTFFNYVLHYTLSQSWFLVFLLSFRANPQSAYKQQFEPKSFHVALTKITPKFPPSRSFLFFIKILS
jgi:hypothetical protein